MTITLLYFAAVREIAGRAEQELNLPEGVTSIGALRTYLEQTVALLNGRLQSVRWAKNEMFVELDTPLNDGDVIAIIPPVAGG